MTTRMLPLIPAVAGLRPRWTTSDGTFYPVDVGGGYRIRDEHIAEARAAGFTPDAEEFPSEPVPVEAQSAGIDPDSNLTNDQMPNSGEAQ